MSVDLNKEIYEGWTVGDFIDELKGEIALIMNGSSWKKPFKTKAELKKYCMDNQPYYKKYIPEVVQYFSQLYGIK